MPESLTTKKWHVLSITLCTLSAFLLLFFSRSADDNRLTSWKWAFADVELTWFVPLLFLGIIVVYALLNSPITRQRPGLFLSLVSFVICSLFWKVPEVIIDASRYFTQAKHLEIYGIHYFTSQWGHAIGAWTDLPLIPFFYGLIFKFFGETRVFIQIGTSFLFSMTVVVTYLIGKKLWDVETGLFAGALLWGIPYIFSQTPLMLVDVPTMFFLTLSVYVSILALEKGGVWIPASAAVLFCALFSKYSTWMMLSVLVIIYVIYVGQGLWTGGNGTGKGSPNPGPGARDYLYRGMGVALIASIMVTVVLYYKFDIISGQIKFLREYQAPGLRRWGESFISTFLFQVHPFISAAAFFSLFEAFRKKDLKYIIIFWLLFLIVIFQIRRSRYVLVVFPMLTLMASYGLQRIASLEVRRYIVSCIVAVSLVVALFAYLPFLQSMSAVNFKGAGLFLDSLKGEQVEVLTIASTKTAVNSAIAVPMIDLFTEKTLLYNYDENYSLPSEEIETSPLRFTWTYENPNYYMSEKDISSDIPIVVISNSGDERMPEHIEDRVKGYTIVKKFETATGLFRYSPVVAIYLPSQ